jgi:hypothetical protein
MEQPARIITIKTDTYDEIQDPAGPLVKGLFWSAFIIQLIAETLTTIQPVVSIFLHVIAFITYVLNATFLCFGIWMIPENTEVIGPSCDCCSATDRKWRSYRGACCGCTCLSKPYVIASTVFAVLSILGIIVDISYL